MSLLWSCQRNTLFYGGKITVLWTRQSACCRMYLSESIESCTNCCWLLKVQLNPLCSFTYQLNHSNMTESNFDRPKMNKWHCMIILKIKLVGSKFIYESMFIYILFPRSIAICWIKIVYILFLIVIILE